MLKSVFTYAPRRFLVVQLTLVGLEQAAIAASTLMLALAAKSMNQPKILLVYLAVFMALNQLPNLILIFIRRSEMSGYVKMYGGFLQRHLLSQSGRPAAWAKHSQKEKFLTAVGPEAEGYISSVAYSYLDIYSYVLSIILNTLALGYAIDANYIWVFLASMALSFLAYRGRRSAIENAVTTEQVAKLDLAAYVLKSWDNVLLANGPVQRRYADNLRSKLNQTAEQAAKSATQSSAMIFLVGLVSAIPVLAITFHTAVTHAADLTMLAAMMATLPRQISLLATFRSLFTQIANLKIFSIRLNSAVGGSMLEELDLQSQIQSSLNQVRDIIFEQIRAQRKGRILVQGPNGAGKSSLLLHLHGGIPGSFYLPTAPALEIGEDFSRTSTGQRMLVHLKHIAGLDPGVLLLDEWDANLDAANRELVSAELDRLARSRLIVEVRH